MKKSIASVACVSTFGLCLFFSGMTAKAQATSSPETASPPTLLDMPLVGVDEGQRFQQVRSVQTSSVSVKQLLPASTAAASGPSLASVTGEALNQPQVEPTLGHPLPTTAKTPLGFPRADFAIGKRAAEGKGAKAAGTSQSSASALSNTVIQ